MKNTCIQLLYSFWESSNNSSFDVCFQLSLEICNLFQTDLHYILRKKKKKTQTHNKKLWKLKNITKRKKKGRNYSGVPVLRWQVTIMCRFDIKHSITRAQELEGIFQIVQL